MKDDRSVVTVMIIDDEPANLSVLGTMLRDAGWEVQAFPRGMLALAAARLEAPDLILLDIRMPEMDGYEVCRRFKADPDLEGIPIIFLSAFTNLEDKVRAFETGGVDYVTKPFAEVEVQARVRTHLRLRRHQLELEDLVEQRVEELAEAHRRLQIWDGAKTEWLNVLSHEMRTPLNGLVGISEVLFNELPPDSAHRALHDDFNIASDRIEKLMNDAVTLAQINVDATHFEAIPVSLAQTLRHAREWVAAQVSDCEIHAELSVAADVAILGEPRLLSRAFGDLLLTAAHCVTEGEPIKVSITVTSKHAKVLIQAGEKPLPTRGLQTFFEVGGQRVLLKGGGDFGLGAALASRIIRLFHGQVVVRNGPGLILEIILPTMAS